MEENYEYKRCSKLIGKGSYGVIRKGVLNGKKVAIKEVESSTFNPLEVSIMSTYDYPVLNNAIKVEIGENGNYLIYQDIAMCDLREIMCNGNLSLNLKKVWMLDMCEALIFLRKENIVHGDVKPTNILVYENNTIKLTDFGCSVLICSEKATLSTQQCGTLSYNSPETLDRNEVSHKSDIWSLGCVFYELMTGTNLLNVSRKESNATAKALKALRMWRTQQGDETPLVFQSNIKCLPVSFRLDGVAADLVNSMLRFNAKDRACLSSVINHLWFRPANLKDRVLNAHVNCLMVDRIKGKQDIVNYLNSRQLKLPDHILEKSHHLYSLMSTKSRDHIECAIIIAYKLYKQDANYYHALARKSTLASIETNFYTSVSFMVHKCSFHETYVDLESI